MGNEQKTPLARTLSIFATKRAQAEIAKRGQSLPGHVVSVQGSIVTVSFDVTGVSLPQVTMPVFGPEFIRYPIQVNDLGVAFPASVSIAATSGLGSTTADTTLQGNLSTLVWFPIANANWSQPPGTNSKMLALYGSAGIALLDSLMNNGSLQITSTSFKLKFGSSTITLDATGVTISGGTTIDGKVFLAHEHGGVQIGGSNTTGVV